MANLMTLLTYLLVELVFALLVVLVVAIIAKRLHRRFNSTLSDPRFRSRSRD